MTPDLPWSPGSTTAALCPIKELREWMERAGLSIKQASLLVSYPVARSEGRIDWELVASPVMPEATSVFVGIGLRRRRWWCRPAGTTRT